MGILNFFALVPLSRKEQLGKDIDRLTRDIAKLNKQFHKAPKNSQLRSTLSRQIDVAHEVLNRKYDLYQDTKEDE